MTINYNNTTAFGIKIKSSDSNSLEYNLFCKAIDDSTKVIPGFIAEGMGNVKRSLAKESVKVPLAFIPTPYGGIEAGIETTREVKHDAIFVGVDSRYDVSFGYMKDILVESFCGSFPAYPVYDLRKDFVKIIKKLEAYILDKYAVERKKVRVVRHSQFTLVGSKVVRNDDYETLNRLTRNNYPADSVKSAICAILSCLR